MGVQSGEFPFPIPCSYFVFEEKEEKTLVPNWQHREYKTEKTHPNYQDVSCEVLFLLFSPWSRESERKSWCLGFSLSRSQLIISFKSSVHSQMTHPFTGARTHSPAAHSLTDRWEMSSPRVSGDDCRVITTPMGPLGKQGIIPGLRPMAMWCVWDKW